MGFLLLTNGTDNLLLTNNDDLLLVEDTSSEISGVAASTLGGLSAFAAVDVRTAASNLGSLTATGVGLVLHSGTINTSLGGLSSAATGTVVGNGATAAAVLGGLSVAVVGQRVVRGTIVKNLGGLSGTVLVYTPNDSADVVVMRPGFIPIA